MKVMLRSYILPLFLSMLALSVSAQRSTYTTYQTHKATSKTYRPSNSNDSTSNSLLNWLKANKVLTHLDLGVDLGTTGLGITATLPIGDIVKVRAGLNYIPRTNVPMTFDLMSYAGTDDSGDSEDKKFNKLAGFLESFTGMKVDRKVDMNGHGTMVDFKFMVDAFPFKTNKHWYVTAGFLLGSDKVGHIENKIHEAPSLMGVLMYNRMYDYFVNEEFWTKPLFGEFSIDPILGWELKDKFLRYGRLGAHVGNFNSNSPFTPGTPYMLVPDDNGTIHADMYVHKFKPYLGMGFTTNLSKDGRWNFGVDAGALFWGRPRIQTHEHYIYDNEGNVSWGTITDPDAGFTYGDQIDLATDVDDIGGKVGTYVRVAKAMHVYPVLNMRITYKLF